MRDLLWCMCRLWWVLPVGQFLGMWEQAAGPTAAQAGWMSSMLTTGWYTAFKVSSDSASCGPCRSWSVPKTLAERLWLAVLSLFAVFKAEVEVQLHICLTLHKLACLKISARSDYALVCLQWLVKIFQGTFLVVECWPCPDQLPTALRISRAADTARYRLLCCRHGRYLVKLPCCAYTSKYVTYTWLCCRCICVINWWSR